MPNERHGKGVDINVGDVITITRGNRYPPKEDKIAIVIDVLDFDVPDEKTLVVLWDDGMGEISSRRAKILDKNEHTCTKLLHSQLNYIHNQSLTQELSCQNKLPHLTTLSSRKT